MKIRFTADRPALRMAALAALTLPLCTLAFVRAAEAQTPGSMTYDSRTRTALSNSLLAQEVRAGTGLFTHINVAFAMGYAAATSCVSGPDAGAMGVHLLHMSNGKPDRIADGTLLPGEPEALIYEPQPDGRMRLVGVEFIELAADWDAHNPKGPPSVQGNLMNLVGEPNRYGLPAFYELHVWAWENNPLGTYADWNTQVTCEHQRAPQ